MDKKFKVDISTNEYAEIMKNLKGYLKMRECILELYRIFDKQAKDERLSKEDRLKADGGRLAMMALIKAYIED